MINRSRWSGFLYDGRTADRKPVDVSITADGIILTGADGVASLWPIRDVRQTQGALSREHVRLEFGPEPAQTLHVSDQSFGDALNIVFPTENPTLRSQRRNTRIVVWTVGAFVGSIVLYLFGANVAADWAARRIPVSWETSLGASVAARYSAPDRQCTDSESVAAINSILERLVVASSGQRYPFRLTIARDSAINAFAAPGGFVMLNSGLLAAAKSPEEVAGVLAHEIEHVVHRHSTRAILREAPLRIAISAVFGSGGGEALASTAGNLGALSYRRADEAEADREGMRLLQAAHIDPRGMVSFMRELETFGPRISRVASYLTDHPYTGDRVAALEKVASEQRGETTPLMDSITWTHVRSACATTDAGRRRTK